MQPFPQKPPSAVIFDMDGTIVQHIDQRILNIVEWLDDRIFNLSSGFSRLLPRNPNGKPILDVEAYAKRRKPLLLGHRTLHKLRRKNVDQIVQPSLHIHDILQTLKDRNIPVALASNGLGKGYGLDVLEVFDLSNYFTTTVFREDIRKSKPHPESLLLVLRKLDLTLSKDDIVWYIGDRRKDVKAAIKADALVDFNIVPIAYTDDAALQIPKENLSQDYVIKSYEDLNQLLLSFLEEDQLTPDSDLTLSPV